MSVQPVAGDFVHLHVHTEYSLLDGLGRCKALVEEALKLGQTALAITDHGAMAGVIEFHRACVEKGVKPLLGIEAYQTIWGRPMGGRDAQLDKENYHLLLLAKDMTGYRNLLKLASHAQMDGFYYRPRLDHTLLAAHAQGLVATTGCLGAEVPQLLMQGKDREAYDRLGWWVETFGRENFFIELQQHEIPELTPVNKQLVEWTSKFNLQMVVTNDVHYVREEDGGPHDVLLCVQTGVPISQQNRMRMSDGSYFLKSRAQMEETFRPFIDLPASAFDNTLRIAEMCNVNPEDRSYHLPNLPLPAGEQSYESWLRRLTEAGIERLYGARAQEETVQARKEHELRVIHEMGFDVYYLIVADLCDFARSRNIWWNVRGSGAGSLVAYCTGITSIDPLKNNLIFERFLNPGRVTMPDFDLDYPDDQREEMIRYTIEKFGSDQVAQIVTFGRMKARAAVRDVGRAQALELSKVDQIAKLIPGIPGKPVTIKDCFDPEHEFHSPELVEMYQREEWVRSLIDTSQQLEGVARHSGIHAAAVIVADRELSHYTPLMRPTKGSITQAITQFEFPILESIGLLKVDFLGLSTLSVMREAARLIRERHGVDYTLATIPYEGEEASEAFRLLSSGEVSGVFQVESAGMRSVLTEMKPTSFEHIVATISLYRPGPMEYIPKFIRCMHGKEQIEYDHPLLEPILAETYGIIVYQEQIIQILSALAGYSPGEADLVRRAIGKKKEYEIAKQKSLFVAGCVTNGIAEETAEMIYEDIAFFARYGFNKSHAADYAVITVQTAWLKAHYPVEFMAAQLLVERDKTEKVVNFVSECRRMGIDVLPPDINYSGLDFEIQLRPADTASLAHGDAASGYPFPVPEGSAIRFGMAAIKNVGEHPVQLILDARAEGGPFATLEELCDRVNLQRVGKRPLECLVKAGALDRFGKRSQLLAAIDQMVSQSKAVFDARESGQLSIFDLLGGGSQAHVAPVVLTEMEEVTGREKLQWEKELLGVYTMSHPLQNMDAELRRITTCTCVELDERYDGRGVTLAGLVTSVRVINTKKGDQMAFVQLEDLSGGVEVTIFPRVYAEYRAKLVVDELVLVRGTAQTRNNATSVLADSIYTHFDRFFAAEDEHAQPKLLAVAPYVNGVAAAMEDESDADEAQEEREASEADGYTRPLRVEPAVAILSEEALAYADQWAGGAQEPRHGAAANEPPPWATGGAWPDDANLLSAPPAPAKGAPTVAPKAAPKAAPAPNPAPNPAPVAKVNGVSAQSKAPAAAQRATVRAGVADDKPEHIGRGLPPEPPERTPLPAPFAPPAAPQPVESTPPAALPPVTPPPVTPPPAPPVEPPAPRPRANSGRALYINFRRTGDGERDKFRLKQIYDLVRDPKGRDRFFVRIIENGHTAELSFPNDPCTISDRLLNDLRKHYKLDVTVE